MDGVLHKVRALVDSGSEVSLVTNRLAKRIGVPVSSDSTTLRGIGGHASCTTQKRLSFDVQLRLPTPGKLCISALVLRELGLTTPSTATQRRHWHHLQDLDLADPHFSSPRKVDVLLGAEVYSRILLAGVRQGSPGEPVAQQTSLGWIVFGTVETSVEVRDPTNTLATTLVTRQVSNDQLQELLRQFWELEDTKEVQHSKADAECERMFVESYSRDTTGRYTVRLPFKDEFRLDTGETLLAARSSLQRTLARMQKDSEYGESYRRFMREYEDLHHLRAITAEDVPEQDRISYLPHHGVWKNSDGKRKLRVVFDASLKTKAGVSLNSLLHTGPALQISLVTIFLQWMLHQFAMVADIEKMYRQIRMDPRDVNIQRIVWHDDETGIVRLLLLLTLTYGLACAPYLALRVLKQLARDEARRFPRAARVIEEATYMDDVFSGADDIDSARQIRDELIGLLSCGGFPLKKWVGNHPDLLENLPSEVRLRPQWKDFGADQPVRTLGLVWAPSEDEFRFALPIAVEISQPTKRSILSVIARLFDPLGWLCPVLITPKILIQDLWRCKLEWDDRLPADLHVRWEKFATHLKDITTLRLPRWLGTTSSEQFDLHGFADASQVAYGAVVYLKKVTNVEIQTPRILLAKARVAPVRTETVPRLELCAAALLAKLLQRVMKDYGERVRQVHAWSDSTIVLSWLADESSRWPVFVSNRVAQIQRDLPSVTWRYVPSEDNPADIASRGITPEDLQRGQQWWNGPSWLSQPAKCWPQASHCLAAQQQPPVPAAPQEEQDDLTSAFSSLGILTRVIARCLRWSPKRRLQTESPPPRSSPPSAAELSTAYLACVRHVQGTHFARELTALQQGHRVPQHSPLSRLCPFVDTSGVLRVGGRLHEARLPYPQRHPVILPKKCHLTQLVIDRAHRASLHGGNALTYAYALRDTWIIGGRPLVRDFVRRCVVCARNRARPSEQMMGDLPSVRVTRARPFSRTGLDYAGPFYLKAAKGRGVLTTKGYLAVFVCLSTKAVHLEVVGDLTTETFLAALRRFSARRGCPNEIWSDNATTFHGADAELRALLRGAEIDWGLVSDALAGERIAWHFIPPAAPHFGGLWEAAVKSAKSHLKKVMGQRSLTYEEMSTLAAQIELVLNSRPLTPICGDVEDIDALTPSHLLAGFALNTFPETTGSGVPENLDHLRHWRLVEGVRNQFWTRWTRDYLNTLQQRGKWRVPRKNLAIGDIVVVLDPSLLRLGRWPLGRVIATQPGRDGRVRVVTVRTQSGEYVRPSTKVSKLPVIT